MVDPRKLPLDNSIFYAYNMNMNKKPHNFTLSDEAVSLLSKRAAEEHRSMSSHIEHLIVQDAKYTQIPVIGRIDDVSDVEYPQEE